MSWFDPADGSWHRAGKLPVATSDAAVVASGDQVWLLGGESPNVTDRVIVVQVS
jgi:N-acetylneuraminic acid mutarotase